jgi:hypothetical protein
MNICRILEVPKMNAKKTSKAETTRGMNWSPMDIYILTDQMGYISEESCRAFHKLSIEFKIIKIGVPNKKLRSKQAKDS